MDFLNTKLKLIIAKYSFAENFFTDGALDIIFDEEKTIEQISKNISIEIQEDLAINPETFKSSFLAYMEQVMEVLGIDEGSKLKTLSILAGYNKNNQKEEFDKIDINIGEIVAIVGPTGSGKSRLLADIEWSADRDTPSRRTILINGKKSDKSSRYQASNKLVAQLSQNMNFVMDLTVEEFLNMHADSRMVANKEELIEEILEKANSLSGEPFDRNQAITSLSGGQSRALMIADTAILSFSPIILIDEIENAGIDRKKALNLLLSSNKIVFIATHDPILALMAKKRIVISKGGISKIISTTEDEKNLLSKLEKLDFTINSYREKLRKGLTLDSK